MIWQSTQSVLSIILFLAAGFLFAKKPWFGPSGETFLSKFCINVAVPLYMIANVYDTIGTKERLAELMIQFLIPLGIILFFLITGYLTSLLLKIPKERQGVFTDAIGFSNVVFVGFPIITTILGDEAITVGMNYYLANTILFWTVGAWFLRRDSGQTGPFFSLANVKRMLPPPIIGFLIGIILLTAEITVPAWIHTPIQKIGATAMPLGLAFVGSVLRNVSWKELTISKDVALLLLSRFLFAPLLLVLLYTVLPIDSLSKQAYFLLTIMPSMTQFGILAKDCGADYKFASVLITLTTVASIIVVPVYSVLMNYLF